MKFLYKSFDSKGALDGIEHGEWTTMNHWAMNPFTSLPVEQWTCTIRFNKKVILEDGR